MQRLKPVLAALLAVPLAILGCGPQRTDDRAEAQAERTEAGAQGQAAQGSMQGGQGAAAVELGSTLGPDGAVTGNNTTFKAGDPVFAEIAAESIAAGSTVRLAWVDPKGATVSTDELVVPPEARAITLKAKDTSGWAPGDYRVDVAVGGSPVGTRTFTITGAGAAD